jgi:hypothetical protein
MTQNPGQWGPQSGYPPQGQRGYPPQEQPPTQGYPPQDQPQGQPPAQGYPPQQQPPPGYAPQPGYNPQGTYAPQGGYPPQGQPPGGYGQPGQQPPPGYGPQGAAGMPPGGFQPQAPTEPPKKSPGLIIGIVVAAVVLLAAIGGIIMVLNRDGGSQPPVSITPSEPVPPTEQPTTAPTTQPTAKQPTATESQGGQPPSGSSVDLGKGISLTPASGWEVQKTGSGVAQLSNGQSVFLGQVIQAEAATNPGQLCDAWHRKVAEDTSNGKFAEPKSVDLGTQKLKGASCQAQVTVSNGQGSATVMLFSLVSVRTSDGVTVIGSTSFNQGAATDQLSKDFAAMVNSMLQGQAKG